VKFVNTQNDPYVIAKRVDIQKKSEVSGLILPNVERLNSEPVAIGQDINTNAERRLFLFHSNSGMKYDTRSKELGEVFLVHKRDIICYIVADDDDLVVEKISQKPIVDPDSEWVMG